MAFQLSNYPHPSLTISPAKPYISWRLSLHLFIIYLLCFVLFFCCLLLYFLPPLSSPLLLSTLWFSPWSVVGLDYRPHAIAHASIFGHADRTEGWGFHTILLQIPSHCSLPSIHPFPPSLCCAIILVQGVPCSLPLLPPLFLYLLITLQGINGASMSRLLYELSFLRLGLQQDPHPIILAEVTVLRPGSWF